MERFEELYERVSAALKDDSQTDYTGPLDPKELWLYALMCARDHLVDFGLFYPVFSDYVDKYQNVREMVPEEILALIDEIGKSDKTLEERMELSKPCIYLAPYMSMSNCLKVLSRTVELVDLYTKQHGELPLDYLLEFANFLSGESPEQIQREIYEFFKEMIKGTLECAGLAVFAEVSSDFLHIEDIKKFMRKRCLEALGEGDTDELVKLAAFYVMEVQGDQLEFAPEESFGALKPYLICDNEKLRHAAHRAAKELAVQGQWDDEIITEFLAMFDSYPTGQHERFFKLASMFLGEEMSDDEEEETEEHIGCGRELVGFAQAQLQKKLDLVTKARLLDLVGVVGDMDFALIDERVNVWMGIAKEIAAGQIVAAYPHTGFFLSVVASNLETPEVDEVIRELLPTLAKACFDSSIPLKRQLILGTDIAYIRNGSLTPPDVTTGLFTLAAETLEGTGEKDAMRACGLVTGLKDSLASEQAQRIFSALIAWIGRVTDEAQIKLLVKTAKKLLKRYPITFESCKPFTSSMLDGSMPVFKGVKPWLLPMSPLCDHFVLLCAIIKKFPESARVAQQVWDWAKEANSWALLAVLDVVYAAIVAERIENTKSKFFDMAQLILQRIKKARLEDNELIWTATNVLAMIYKADKTVLAHPEDYIEPFGRLIDELAEEQKNHAHHHHDCHGHCEEDSCSEEGCDCMEESASIVPAIVRFALDVYSTDPSVDINQEMFLKFFDFMPFSDEEGMVAVIEALNEVVGEERFKFARKSVAILYTRILVLSDDLEIEADVVASMKMAVKNALEEFPGFERELALACGPTADIATEFIRGLLATH